MYKEIFGHKKAVIFDMDGTIIQSNDLWNQAFKTVSQNIGVGFPPIYPAGLPIKEKWIRLIDEKDLGTNILPNDLTQQTHNKYLELLETEPPEITDSFWTFVAELKLEKGYKIGMSTNTPREVTDKVLDIMGFGKTFDYTVCADEVKRPKPHPDIYKKALKDMGLSTAQTLVFEDSPVGVTAAVDAGLDTIVIWDYKTPRENYPSKVVGFIESFYPFPGHLDMTRKEFYQAWIDLEVEIAKRKKANLPPQTQK